MPESEGHLKRGAATAAVAAVAATAVAAVAGAMAKPRGGAVEQSNAASGAVPKKDMKQVNGVHRKASPGPVSPSSVVSAAAAVTAAAAAVSTLSALGDEWDSDTDHEGEGPYSSPESQRGEVCVGLESVTVCPGLRLVDEGLPDLLLSHSCASTSPWNNCLLPVYC